LRMLSATSGDLLVAIEHAAVIPAMSNTEMREELSRFMPL